MALTISKVFKHLPGFPRKRYSIFSGTNTWEEFRETLKCYLFPQSPDTAESVIKRYEGLFAAAAGCAHAYSFASGRMGLYAILEALGVNKGDEVVIPAFTCVVVPNAILYRGAVPVYVDIDPRSFNIDAARVESAITSRTKALYAQHTFGNVCDVGRLRELAEKHGIWLIEDSAHALGTEYDGRKVGSLGDISFFSTDHSKYISTGLGGMVTTNNPELAAKIAGIQAGAPFMRPGDIRRTLKLFLFEYVLCSPYAYWIGGLLLKVLLKLKWVFVFKDELLTDKPAAYPYPARLSAPQAMIGISQLGHLRDNLQHRSRIFSFLEEKLEWNRGTVFPGLRYSFLVRDRGTFERRFAGRFDLAVWFTSVCQGRDSNWEEIRYLPGSCPVAEMVAEHIVNFPTHQRIRLDMLESEIDLNLQWIRDEMAFCRSICGRE